MSHALERPQPSLPSPQAWQVLTEQAAVLIESGLYPPEINTPAKAIVVMLQGRELGIPAMAAIRGIAVIKGKPTCSAQLMAALIERDHGSAALIVEESTATSCTVSYRKAGWEERRSFTFTMADAKRAQLEGLNWQKYPSAMLRARAISAVAMMAFQSTILGLYLPEELGAEVTVTDDGEVVPVSAIGDLVRTPEQVVSEIVEDMADADWVDEPGEVEAVEQTRPAGADSLAYATERQIGLIGVLLREAGFDAATMRAMLQEGYGVASRKGLTVRQASEFIAELKRLIAEKAAKQELPEAVLF